MTAKLRLLSLGAGVQSSTLLMLAADGTIPTFDAAIFADTGWEPAGVYAHLDRLEREVAKPAGIPIHRVTVGNIRNDALDPEHRFASMPLHVLNKDGTPGMARRQCTSEYKLKPLKREIRRLLGFPHPVPVPRGTFVEQAIGFSLDEIHRVKDSDVRYAVNVFPLLDLRWTRDGCRNYLTSRGWSETPKSACIGCPFHGNRAWRDLRDNHPDEWADAVEFDDAIRKGSARANAAGQELRGGMFLHRSRLPLSVAPIDHRTRRDHEADQMTIGQVLAEIEFEEGDPDGCSPHACRSGGAVL